MITEDESGSRTRTTCGKDRVRNLEKLIFMSKKVMPSIEWN